MRSRAVGYTTALRLDLAVQVDRLSDLQHVHQLASRSLPDLQGFAGGGWTRNLPHQLPRTVLITGPAKPSSMPMAPPGRERDRVADRHRPRLRAAVDSGKLGRSNAATLLEFHYSGHTIVSQRKVSKKWPAQDQLVWVARARKVDGTGLNKLDVVDLRDSNSHRIYV